MIYPTLVLPYAKSLAILESGKLVFINSGKSSILPWEYFGVSCFIPNNISPFQVSFEAYSGMVEVSC